MALFKSCMPINAHPDFLAAEKEYHLVEGSGNKLKALEKMISLAPKHKGAENLRAQLKTRYKKLKEKMEKGRKGRRSSRTGIRKEEMQAGIIGFTNTGKSSLLSVLTNAKPKISQGESTTFTTKFPEIGMIKYPSGIQIQLIEIPAFKSKHYDKGLVNTADVILILITDLKQIIEIKKELNKAKGKQIIIFNKVDLLNEKDKRRIYATLQSKKHDFVLISLKTKEGIEELKSKIFHGFDKIRIYTKEPRKEKSEKPIIMEKNSIVKDVAEKILTGFSKKIRETKIWGPSSKFSGQLVGLKHKLKDLDTVEFKTK